MPSSRSGTPGNLCHTHNSSTKRARWRTRCRSYPSASDQRFLARLPVVGRRANQGRWACPRKAGTFIAQHCPSQTPWNVTSCDVRPSGAVSTGHHERHKVTPTESNDETCSGHQTRGVASFREAQGKITMCCQMANRRRHGPSAARPASRATETRPRSQAEPRASTGTRDASTEQHAEPVARDAPVTLAAPLAPRHQRAACPITPASGCGSPR